MIYITAVHLQGGQGHEHIARVRWLSDQNTTGENSTAEMVDWIDKGNEARVRNSAGRDVTVGVVRPTGRPAYLRTYSDSTWTDNLLALPKF